MTVAQRQATFEQALRHRQAGKRREAFGAFIKGGNALDRRAAAWAAIASEEGAGTNVASDVAAAWHVVAATGGVNRGIPVQIEWLGDKAIRYHVKPDHHRVTIRADGSWTRELMHERVRPLSGAHSLTGRDEPEYVIDEDPSGNVTVRDWRGNWWSLAAVDPADRLVRNAQSGDLTFTDDLQRTITVRQNGRRTITDASGNVRRRELDLGGRLVGVYDDAGKDLKRYQYDYRGAAEPVLTRYIGDKGALWGLTPLGGDRQRWTLLNGDNPNKPVHMDVRIGMNRANSVVIEDGNRRIIDAGDGARISETRRQERGGVWVVEKMVGIRQGVAAYTLLTYERGSIFKQELKSGAGHSIRGGEGQNFPTASWWEVDKSGRPKPGRTWAGDIFIDDNGTLIKRSHTGKPDPARPGAGARGESIAEHVTYVYTSGESEERLRHGGVIWRDLAGDVFLTLSPRGELTRFYYKGEGDKKLIAAVREGANPRWTFDEKLGLVSRLPSTQRMAVSALNLTVNRRSGDAEWGDEEKKSRTIYRIDGSRRYVTGDNDWQKVVEVDPDGRVTRFLSPTTPEFRMSYADNGRLVRVDHTYGRGTSIVDSDYKPPAEAPLTVQQVLRGSQLTFLGWGEERYVSFLDTQGRRVNFHAGGAMEEHVGDTGTPLARVTLRGGFSVIKDGHQKSADFPSDWATLAKDISGFSGEGADRFLAYVDGRGRRFHRFVRGGLSEFDAAGKLVRHQDERGRAFQFGYPARAGSPIDSASAPSRTLRRDSLPADVVNFELTRRGDLAISLRSGFEIYDLPAGRKITIGADGSLSKYDHRDRLSYQESVEGKHSFLFYSSDESTSAERNEVGGIRVGEPGPSTLEIATIDDGRLRTLARTVKGRDGATTRTEIVRFENAQWIDEERTRYSAAWISPSPQRVFLATNQGRSMRVIDQDGSETRIDYDEDYNLRSRVRKNAVGEVVAVMHADRSITHFERNAQGKITLMQLGPDVLVLSKDGTFGSSVGRDARLLVSLSVTGQGVQFWTGRNRIERTVRPDGTIDIKRPDGSRTVFPIGGGTRHFFPARVGAAVSETAESPSGDVEWVIPGRAMNRSAAHGDAIEVLKLDRTPQVSGTGSPIRYRGSAAVGPRGDLAILDLDRQTLTVRHVDGATSEFTRTGRDAWTEPATGAVLGSSHSALQRRLAEIGAATPAISSRNQDLAQTDGANRYRLSLGMFEFASQTYVRPRTPSKRPVSLLNAQKLDRPIGSVEIGADGKPQITHAAATPKSTLPPTAIEPKRSGPSQSKTAIPKLMLDMAKKGDPGAQFQLGLRYLKSGDRANAREWLAKAAQSGHRPAMNALKDLGN